MPDVDQDPPLPQSEITAEQLLTRLLELIKSSTSVTDLTFDRVQQALGVPLETYGPGKWGLRSQLTPEWSYSLTAFEKFTLGPRILLDFVNHAQPRAPMTDICQVDVRTFTAELSRTGFSNLVRYGEHGRLLGHDLARGDLTVEMVTEGETGQSSEKAVHSCIKSIMVR